MGSRVRSRSFDSTYEGLKRHDPEEGVAVAVRFDSTYEGLKPRNCSCRRSRSPSFDSTYEGLKRAGKPHPRSGASRFRQYL